MDLDELLGDMITYLAVLNIGVWLVLGTRWLL